MGFQNHPSRWFGTQSRSTPRLASPSTVNDDVLAYKNPKFKRADLCKIILHSAWEA